MLAKLIFDFIIGRNTIKKYRLVKRFAEYFGLLTEKINDRTKETKNTPSDPP